MPRHATSPSRYLSLLLRHKPEIAGLTLSSTGWMPVDTAVAAVKRRCGPFTKQDLRELVAANDKQRFELSPNGRLIRAVQGHSIRVDLGLDEVPSGEIPAELWHGTKAHKLPAILAEGLRPMTRQYVHLSATKASAVQVARRGVGAAVLLRFAPAQAAGPFYRAQNGVWLTPHVAGSILVVDSYVEKKSE